MDLSLSIAANPDVLSLDGSSQTMITIEARDTRATGRQITAAGPDSRRRTGDRLRDDFGAHARHGEQRAGNIHLHRTVIRERTDSPSSAERHANGHRCVLSHLPSRHRQAPAAGLNRHRADGGVHLHSGGAGDIYRRAVRWNRSSAGLGARSPATCGILATARAETGATPTHRVQRYRKLSGAADRDRQSGTQRSERPADRDGGSERGTDRDVRVFSDHAGLGPVCVLQRHAVERGREPSIVSYRWNWGDGNPTSSGSTVSHKFTAPGT